MTYIRFDTCFDLDIYAYYHYILTVILYIACALSTVLENYVTGNVELNACLFLS